MPNHVSLHARKAEIFRDLLVTVVSNWPISIARLCQHVLTCHYHVVSDTTCLWCVVRVCCVDRQRWWHTHTWHIRSDTTADVLLWGAVQTCQQRPIKVTGSSTKATSGRPWVSESCDLKHWSICCPHQLLSEHTQICHRAHITHYTLHTHPHSHTCTYTLHTNIARQKHAYTLYIPTNTPLPRKNRQTTPTSSPQQTSTLTYIQHGVCFWHIFPHPKKQTVYVIHFCNTPLAPAHIYNLHTDTLLYSHTYKHDAKSRSMIKKNVLMDTDCRYSVVVIGHWSSESS